MQVIRAYGAERCLWTSCYPNEIWTPKITYEQHLRIFTEALPLKDSERKLILGENAQDLVQGIVCQTKRSPPSWERQSPDWRIDGANQDIGVPRSVPKQWAT